MSDGSTTTVKAKAAQRDQAKRATLDLFQAKRRAQQEFTTDINGEPVTMLFRAIGSTEWDKLVTKHQPTTEQIARGQVYNPDTFGPALLARVCVEPELSAADWKDNVWDSPDWSQGEVSEIFLRAYNLCNKGLDMVPTAAG